MRADLVVRGARVVTHAGEFHGGVAAAGGRIVAAGTEDALPVAKRVVDADGRYLLPGAVDPHCHLGIEFGFDDDIRTESAAAAAGGITTFLMYARTLEASYVPLYRERSAIGENNAHVDFGFHFGIQREEHIDEIPRIAAETGVTSFKLYFGYAPGNPLGTVSATDGWAYATMRATARLAGGVVSAHCENTEIVDWLTREIRATGRNDLAALAEARPAFSEAEAVTRMILLAEATRCPLYIVHATTAYTPGLAQAARARGVDVAVETCPHYLTRTANDPSLDARAKVLPPLREPEHVEGLWRGILDGTVATVGSDHVPLGRKDGADVWDERPGVVSFPWTLPLLFSEGVQKRGLPLTGVVRLTSYEPARRFGLWPRKGGLHVGADADFVLVDPDREDRVEHTGKGVCLYEGMTLRGWPAMTVSRGHVIFEDGAVDPGTVGHGRCVSSPSA